MSSLRGEMCLSLSAQIAAVIYALSHIPGVHLEGYESFGDCEESYGSYGKLQDTFFFVHFLLCLTVSY